jgi:hypothetical protein
MTKANDMSAEATSIDGELYPRLAAYVENGGKLGIKRTGGLWYVSVTNGTEPGLGITMASADLAYALQQVDMVSGSWVMA